MTTIDVSAKTIYHSQVNNKLYPMSTCNTTSAIMWMLDNHVVFKFPENVQPEDHLTSITETEEAYAYMRRVAPWAWDRDKPKIPPRYVHQCLDWAINRLAGEVVATFRVDVTLQELMAQLANGRAVMVSGPFTRSGHIVCLVGAASKQPMIELKDPRRVKLDQIASWAVDDPYGNYHTGYQDRRGNNVWFLPDEFDRLTKEVCQNKKWAHLYVGGVA